MVNNGYLPDTTYNVTISYTQPNITKYGFQVTVLDSTNSPVGTMINTSSRTQKKNGCS
jgi:hypothetical protein